MDSKKIKEWLGKLTAGGARTWLRKDRLLILLLAGVLLLVITGISVYNLIPCFV